METAIDYVPNVTVRVQNTIGLALEIGLEIIMGVNPSHMGNNEPLKSVSSRVALSGRNSI